MSVDPVGVAVLGRYRRLLLEAQEGDGPAVCR